MPTNDPEQILASYQEAVASAITDHARHMAELSRAFLMDMKDAGTIGRIDLQALVDELTEVEDQLTTLEDDASQISSDADEAYQSVDGANDEMSGLASTVRDIESNVEDAMNACSGVREKAQEVSGEAQGMSVRIETLIGRVREAMVSKPVLDGPTVMPHGAVDPSRDPNTPTTEAPNV